jgi:hypothetical protein
VYYPTGSCHGIGGLPCWGRQSELKDGAAQLVRARPQSSLVGFDDGPADREPQPQAAGLGGVEGREQLLQRLCRQSRTRVCHRDEHSSGAVPAGADQQVSRGLAGARHRLDSVDDEIERRYSRTVRRSTGRDLGPSDPGSQPGTFTRPPRGVVWYRMVVVGFRCSHRGRG